MSNTYAFQRPVVVVESVPKKTRRNKYDTMVLNSGSSTTFKYLCYTCKSEIDVASHNTIEIECAECGGRILKKRASEKPRVLEAV